MFVARSNDTIAFLYYSMGFEKPLCSPEIKNRAHFFKDLIWSKRVECTRIKTTADHNLQEKYGIEHKSCWLKITRTLYSEQWRISKKKRIMEWVHFYTEKHSIFQQHMFTWPLLIVWIFRSYLSLILRVFLYCQFVYRVQQRNQQTNNGETIRRGTNKREKFVCSVKKRSYRVNRTIFSSHIT